jgi:hypothetical protein
VDRGQRGRRHQPLVVLTGLDQQAVLADPGEHALDRAAPAELDPHHAADRAAQPVQHGDPAGLGPDPVGHLAVQVAVPQRVELGLQVLEQGIQAHGVNLPAPWSPPDTT